jgi:hypothetical protein
VGNAWARGGGGGSERRQICPQATRNVPKQRKTEWFQALIDLKIEKNAIFYFKHLIGYISETFLRNALMKKFVLLEAMLTYSCSKFQKSYMLPAAWIRVKVYSNILRRTGICGV